VLEEGPRNCGWGAEVAGRLQEDLFGHLAAPVLRVGAADSPLPAAIHLEREVLPSAGDVERAIRRVLEQA
jgi:pyruvate dehydrogenase E1 component beta subunit